MALPFGKCGVKPIETYGCTEAKIIVNKFVHYFADSSSANNVTWASELYDVFTRMREQYCDAPLKDEF